MTSKPLRRFAAIVLIAFSLVAIGLPASANDLGRDREPVVLLGSDLPDIAGVAPANIVAFRFDVDWVQIPVQIDERAVVDFGTIYNTDPIGYTVLTYTDTSTFTGPDPVAVFDADDELVLAARDAGARAAAAAEPASTIPGTGLELELSNPSSGSLAYVYLFESDGTLPPGAGEERVTYDFFLESGPYKQTYGTMSGPNPEDTHVIAPSYRVHFADRWIRDETGVTAGAATGVDILDRHKNLFGPGVCSRSEDTFSAGEGALIVNRGGPIRVLRGYVGANSGPTTYRIHAFYEEREDIVTALRVHPIAGMMDFFDYSPDAAGMIYRNDLNTGGVTIDGAPDAIVPGAITWEMVTGGQGTMAILAGIVTDIPSFTYTSYYSDDSTPSVTQCTGDAYEYGSSGIWVDHAIPNTDPALGAHYVFEGHRAIAYGPPDQAAAYVLDFETEIESPIGVAVSQYSPSTAVDGGGLGDASLRVTLSPSPSRGQVTVAFATPSSGRVLITLYDLAGRKVATLLDETMPAGRHSVTREVSRLPSAVYFVRAVGPEGRPATSKIALLR